jgi:hypothetical protein
VDLEGGLGGEVDGARRARRGGLGSGDLGDGRGKWGWVGWVREGMRAYEAAVSEGGECKGG